MQEWIRQIIIYVILVTVLRGLIMKPQYEQYFRFFSGIVLILLVVSPVLRVIHQDTAWHDTVEQYLFQMDVNDIQEQLAVTEGRRQEVIMQQYTEQLEEQIKKQAGKHALRAVGYRRPQADGRSDSDEHAGEQNRIPAHG